MLIQKKCLILLGKEVGESVTDTGGGDYSEAESGARIVQRDVGVESGNTQIF